MIRAKNVVKSFFAGEEHEVAALRGVSLDVDAGTICVILGPSGSGKSTLLKCLSGLEALDSGEVTVGERKISGLSKKDTERFRRHDIGFVFQEYNLIDDLTIRENIALERPLLDETLRLIQKWGINDVVDHFPHQCSGGQQQKCAILRALNKQSSVLFCDEPTGALDAESARDVFTVLQETCEDTGMTIIMITHNELVTKIAHHIIRIHDGSVVESTSGRTPMSAREITW